MLKFSQYLPFEKFDSAVMSRTAKIDMTLTSEQMFIRMESLLPELGDKSVPLDEKKRVLEFLKQKSRSGALDDVSMRTFVAALDVYKSGLPNWQELLEYV